MMKIVKRRSQKAGLPPGSIVYVGEKKEEKVRIRVMDYDEEHVEEREPVIVEECFPFKDKPSVTWINIDGIHQVDIIEKLGTCYGLHPLIMEDIVNTQQRPKMEDYGSYIFIVIKMLYREKDSEVTESEQISLVVGSNFVISFQEQQGDVFEAVRDRIRKSKGRIRKAGADYLAYALMDAIVDNYFVILEEQGELIENVEDQLTGYPLSSTLQEIRKLKKEMIFMRRAIWPVRELISGLERTESVLINKSTGDYLRDLYDHSIQIIDSVESYRDIISGLLDIYLSSVSNRMNEVMKVLTIFASIFIPLTFVAGVYGMNFDFMPELGWHWGYFTVLGFMVAVGIIMVIYFKRKKWL